jgi:hypothetical protein
LKICGKSEASCVSLAVGAWPGFPATPASRACVPPAPCQPGRGPEQRAATSVLLAASPLVRGVSGRYFEDRNEAELTTDPAIQHGVWPHALNEEDATRLWDVSEAMLRS